VETMLQMSESVRSWLTVKKTLPFKADRKRRHMHNHRFLRD